MAHEEGNVCLEIFLAFPPQVPDEPLGVEGVLRRHPPSHDGVEEGLALSSVESEHFNLPVDLGQKRRERAVASVAAGRSLSTTTGFAASDVA